MASSDADRRTYKTVAMPQTIRGGRRRGKTKAERVAFAMSEIINAEAAAGWSYIGSDTVRTEERAGLFGGVREAVYTVLVFERGAAEGERREPQADLRRRAQPPAAELRRDPDESMRAASDAVRRQAAEAAGQRSSRRGYGFDDELTADRGDGRDQRSARRRETRPAGRRADDDWGDDDGRPGPEASGRRGLVETMRSHRQRN